MVALEEMARNMREMFHIECRFECEGEVLIADNVVAVHLYRIAQEAAHNAVRHGGAKKIVIRLRTAENEATLDVRDDGRGMPDDLPPLNETKSDARKEALFGFGKEQVWRSSDTQRSRSSTSCGKPRWNSVGDRA
jgi:anti-sigma regulatory factor (Ser/Thr protein kinase)